jgi:hypothetical protein
MSIGEINEARQQEERKDTLAGYEERNRWGRHGRKGVMG